MILNYYEKNTIDQLQKWGGTNQGMCIILATYGNTTVAIAQHEWTPSIFSKLILTYTQTFVVIT